jgi:predicted membrane protein
MSEKLSHEEFVKKAIISLRKDGYKGIHSVYSGFNEAFKKYFNGENPVDVTNRLAQEGKIVIRPVKGGVMLYLPEDAPKRMDAGEEALKKMGL